jgi:predicted SAM-dependent methyltransferase
VTVLDLGCGLRKLPGAVGVDKNPRSGADLLADLDAPPYPFRPNRFSRIECLNLLEHLNNLIPVLEELHRLLRPGGWLHLVVPHFSSLNAYSDLTHRHFFSSQSFDHFCGEFPEYAHYTDFKFEKRACRFHLWKGWKWLLEPWANRNPLVYEKYLAFIFPCMSLEFWLRARK